MNKLLLIFKRPLLSFLIIFYFLSSCGSKKDVVYFQNAKNFETMVDTDTFTPKFKVNDIVSVFVSTFDLEAVKPFNMYKSAGENQSEIVDYIIDINGNIDYPVLGKIKLIGLTVEEAKALFKEKLSDYLKDPIVNIRILNFRISVLGQVNSPGRYEVSGERITLLEAIAMAGDLTIKGERKNVLVIRDFNGTKTYSRFDLTSKELFNSPVYYLTQNDVVYVEPNRSAVSGAASDSRAGIILSIASLLATTAFFILNN